MGISYTFSNDCQDAYTVNAYDIAQYGELLKYKSGAGQWYVCNVNPVNGPYGAPFMSNTSATRGLNFVGPAGSEGGCGSGWYYVAAIGYVWQSGAWRGTEPNLVQTPSVIYMNYSVGRLGMWRPCAKTDSCFVHRPRQYRDNDGICGPSWVISALNGLSVWRLWVAPLRETRAVRSAFG